MKRLALLLLLISSPAYAQPEEIESEGLINLTLGEAKAFTFKDPIGEIYFAPENIIKAQPQSDRQFTIAPLISGSTRMFVRSNTGKLMYNADIVVAPEPGRIVRHYGYRDIKDFIGFYCTEFGCGRADKELGGNRDPSSVSVTERVPTASGGFVEKTKTYGTPR